MTELEQENMLPDNLIDLLKLAVSDARKCEADDKYFMNMGAYHMKARCLTGEGKHEIKCHVCMAGSIIAKTLKGDIDAEIGPSNYGRVNYSKLHLIDEIRAGYSSEANVCMKNLEWSYEFKQSTFRNFYLEDGDLDEWERFITKLENEIK